jgi:hypothetical protein
MCLRGPLVEYTLNTESLFWFFFSLDSFYYY